MGKKLVICELNEEYLKSVKDQMQKQNMPVPKEDSQITIAHRPLAEIEKESVAQCDCAVCKKLNV